MHPFLHRELLILWLCNCTSEANIFRAVKLPQACTKSNFMKSVRSDVTTKCAVILSCNAGCYEDLAPETLSSTSLLVVIIFSDYSD